MPRGRKRIDPAEAPIDGDFAQDVVLNKKKGYSYKWLSVEDIPRFKANGFTVEERGPDSARPAFDHFADAGLPDFKVGSLTLYKAPDAIAARLDGIAQRKADQNISTIRAAAKASGGDFTSEQLR